MNTLYDNVRRAALLLREKPLTRQQLQGKLGISMTMTRKVIRRLQADGVIHTLIRPTQYERKMR